MKENNKSNLLLWGLLIFLPPFGILYIWIAKKEISQQKKKKLSIIFSVWFIFCMVFGRISTLESQQPDSIANTNNQQNSSSENSSVSAPPILTNSPKNTATDADVDKEQTVEPITTTEPTKKAKPTRKSRKKSIGKSDKDISNLDDNFKPQDMREDVTGNFRKVEIADISFIPQEYALSYYKNCFKDDKEVHYIVNFSTMTTTCITCVVDMLNVTVTEYIDKEQFSAKSIGGGTVLEEYMVYLDNGDIEKIKN